MKLQKWTVEVSQNGWKYIGHVYIKCVQIKKVSKNTILADDVEIEFDEEVRIPEQFHVYDSLDKMEEK